MRRAKPRRPSERLRYRNHRDDPDGWGRALGVPREAVETYLACEVIDLHVVSFVWTRALPRYDIAERHRPRLPRSAFLNQVDLPRVREAQLAAVCWDIPTNPWRRTASRERVTDRNVTRIVDTLARFPDDFRFTRTASDYRAARAAGLTAGFVGMQGGDGVGPSLDALDALADRVHRITLVELTESELGVPSNKKRRANVGLTRFGREFAARMQANGILVDLTHLNRRGFFDGLDATDPSVPVVVTHTGVSAIRPLWRNIDDEQLRAVAARGGTIGIVFHPYFLEGVRCRTERIVDHMEHVVRTVGEDFVSFGSDFDGMIYLPDGFEDVTHLPKLVAIMLERGWSHERIAKVMGGNFLRVLAAVSR